MTPDPTNSSAAASPAAGPHEPAPLYSATLWPHRSLSPRGHRLFLTMLAACIFVFVIAITLAPGVPTLPGGAVTLLIATVPFFVLAFAMVWFAFSRNRRDARLTERVLLFPDRLRVERFPPRGQPSVWEAAPHWVRVILRTDRSAQNRLLLMVSGKGVELGSFLSPEERCTLAAEIERALGNARSQAAHPAP